MVFSNLIYLTLSNINILDLTIDIKKSKSKSARKVEIRLTDGCKKVQERRRSAFPGRDEIMISGTAIDLTL